MSARSNVCIGWKQLLAPIMLVFAFSAQAQINVNTSATVTQIINNLVGSGNTVSNVVINCPTGAYGTFSNGSTTNVGMNAGVVLTTGDANAINGLGSSFASQDNNTSGNILLDGLAGAGTYDACSIEFDIIPACSTLQMQYVFGSEEYPEFVNSGYNDAFGFFISGPNPAGGNYNNLNIAVVPSTTTPVTIDNVNSSVNSQYYVDNQNGTTIAYDGFTTPLTATVNVVPCTTYHMIIVIADGGDGIYDSGVFLTYQGLTCPTPQVTASNDVTVCPGQSTTLTATVNATNPTYTWSPTTYLSSSTGSSVTATPVTTTTYVVTATSGLCNVSTDTVVVTVTPSPTVTVTPSSASICPNNSVTLTASGATSYTWSPSTGLNTTTGSTVTATPSATTVYTVIGSNGSCSDTATATITVGNTLLVDAGPDQNMCQGGSVTLSVTGMPAGSTFSWSPTTGLSSPTSASTTCTAASTTTYVITVTDPTGCTGSDTITVNVNLNPSLATAGFPPNCSNTCDGQVVVIPSGGTQPYTYLWNTGCITPSCINMCPGNYSITVTDAMGCQVSGTVTVPTTPALVLTTTSTPSTCGLPDGTACVQVSGGNPGYTYLWSPGGQTTACATNLVPGAYCVTVTDVNGCTDTACVTVPNSPGITVTVCSLTDPTCNGVPDGAATVCATGGTSPYTFSWSNGLTVASGINLAAGTYTVNVSDANGCTDSVVVIITDPPVVTVTTSSPVTICIGQSTPLTATGAGGTGSSYTYDWDNGAFAGSPYTVNPSLTTVYSVVATDTNGCASAPQTVTVTVNPSLDVTAGGSTTVCPGGTAELIASATGGDGTYTYTWLPAGTGTGTPVNVTVNSTTTYTVIVADGCGTPSDTDTVTIFVSPLPVVDFTADTTVGCAPLCANFTDLSTTTTGTITAWEWDFGDNSTSTLQNPSHCYSLPGIYSVSLTVTNSSGCEETYVFNNMITNHGYPIAQFSLGPQPTTVLNPEICFTDESMGAATWSWNFDDPTDPSPSSLQNPCFSYSDTGTFCVELIVTNTGGCTDTVTECLVIMPESTFWIPNAFTPNDDGINDEFSGVGMYITEYEMFIFDRWGDLIFYTEDIQKKWNGKANNGSNIAQEDVYVYVIKFKDSMDKEHKYIGRVTLIK